MKCFDCSKMKAEYQCKDCGEYYCEDCANLSCMHCECCDDQNIIKIKKENKKKK